VVLFPGRLGREVGVEDKLIAAITGLSPNHAALINNGLKNCRKAALGLGQVRRA